MTEIPEHLLKRSKAAKSGGAVEKADEAPAKEVEATKSSTPAAPAKEFPNLDPKPAPAAVEPAFINAAKARKKIPTWVLPVIAALPIWAFSFAGTMQERESEDIVAIESELFYGTKGCAGCHGGTGGGGTGYAFADGEVLETFPEPIDMMVHIVRGSAEIQDQPYGAERADGQRRTAGERGAMPAQLGQISMIELELLVYHERHTLSGEEAESEEYLAWVEHMEEAWEDGGAEAPSITEEDLDLLLACADPEVTPGATGEGAPGDEECPGPQPAAEGEE